MTIEQMTVDECISELRHELMDFETPELKSHDELLLERIVAELERLRKLELMDDNLDIVHSHGYHRRDEEVRELRKELERLRERALPDLPEGFVCMSLEFGTCRFSGNSYSSAFLTDQLSIDVNGNGPTPRAAVQAAIDKIKTDDKEGV